MNRVLTSLLAVLFLIAPAKAADMTDVWITEPAIKAAWDQVKAEKPAEALKTLSSARRTGETNIQYHFVRGSALKALKRSVEAADHFRQASIFAASGPLRELSFVLRGESYLEVKYFHEAASVFSVFIKRFPDSAYLGRAHIGLAEALSNTGKAGESLAHFDKAEGPRAAFGKAEALQKSGMTRAALEAYKAAAAKYPDYLKNSEETMLSYSENLIKSGRLADAEHFLNEIKADRLKPAAELGLGLIASAEGKHEEAAGHFGTAVSSGDLRIKRRALLGLASAQLKSGKPQEAASSLEELRTKHPYTPEYYEAGLRLAEVDIAKGEYAKAAGRLRELLYRKNPPAEAFAESEAVVRGALSKNDREGFAKAWALTGRWLLDASREKFLLETAGSPAASREAVREIGNYLLKYGSPKAKYSAMAALARQYSEEGNYAKARGLLQGIKGGPEVRDELLGLEARISFSEGDCASAAGKILLMKKTGASDLALLDDVITCAPDRKKAFARYEKLIAEKGGNLQSFIRMGDYMIEQRKNREALSWYEKALEKDPGNEWASYRTSCILTGDEALKVLSRSKKSGGVVGAMASARAMEIEIIRKFAENE